MKLNNKLISKNYLTLISGPCAIESEKMALDTAEFLKELTNKLKILDKLQLLSQNCLNQHTVLRQSLLLA